MLYKGKEGELIAVEKQILESWKEYLEKLFYREDKLKDSNKENQNNRPLQGEETEIIADGKEIDEIILDLKIIKVQVMIKYLHVLIKKI